MDRIKTENAPAALGPYSQGTTANGMIFTAGQIPVDPSTGAIPETVEDQTRQALKNVIAIVNEGGPADIVNINLFISDMSEFSKINAVYSEFFKEPYPARTCVEASSLPKGVKVEIAAIAVRKN